MIVLLIIRGNLSNRESDQLFLDSAEAHMEAEQVSIMKRMNRLKPFVRMLDAASGVLILLIVTLAVWQQMRIQ